MSEDCAYTYILEVSHQPSIATGSSPKLVILQSPVAFKPGANGGYDELGRVVFEKVVQEHTQGNVSYRTRSFDEYFTRNIEKRYRFGEAYQLFSQGLGSLVYAHQKHARVRFDKDHHYAKFGLPEYIVQVSVVTASEFRNWKHKRDSMHHAPGKDRQSSIDHFVYHRLQRFPSRILRYEPFLLESLLPVKHIVDGEQVPYLRTFDTLERDDQCAIMDKAVLAYGTPALLEKWSSDEIARRTNPQLAPAHINDAARSDDDIRSRVAAKHDFIGALSKVCSKTDLVEMGQSLSIIPRTHMYKRDGLRIDAERKVSLLETLIHTTHVYVPGEIPGH